jgi:hypothetical protein
MRIKVVVSFTPRPLFTPGQKKPVPIGQEAGWTRELVWTNRLEEKSFTSAGDRTPFALSYHRFSTHRWVNNIKMNLK